jgi:hypothetical protein
MKPKKSKGTEPSLRDKLSAKFMKDFEADFAANGAAVIAELRTKSPEKYAEIASRLIAQTEPPNPNDLSNAKTMHDVGRMLLQGVGLHDPSDQQIEAAMAANNRLMSELEMIVALDVSMKILDEERELRQ